MTFTREQIEAAVKAKSYAWFEGAKDYDVNIVGIRNSTPGKKVTNIFDDTLILLKLMVNGNFIHGQSQQIQVRKLCLNIIIQMGLQE